MRLIEPLGLLDGPEARDAIDAGEALPLMGGAFAFALARLIEASGQGRIVAARALPDEWRAEANRLAALPEWVGRDWAGPEPGLAVMGILNATPDSFSDGGRHLDPGRAEEAGRAMVAAGARFLDIGGESTRPGAAPVAPEEEQARILPVIRRLRDAGAPISVDTRNASTMAAALDAGAAIVNDVSALAHDPDAAALVARRGCPVVLMHMRGTPETMMGLRDYADLAADVTRELAARIEAAERAGIPRAHVAVDPGIGFAKGERQSLEMLRRLPVLLNLGCRVLVGVSRKGFVSRISGAEAPADREAGSLAAALDAAGRGATIFRVHDVPATVRAMRLWQALRG